ncbi:Amidohydrolase 3 [Solidesulfovibrio fructosivorans JJ]]|uniref:Amidohydrolase 3 n=1 Tax=Solidesulfovibrio fructosivorans JJ] TaxID=596151 RepID=E1JY07_SOLFR|nr:amidohydrolase family protein [Solidesulfovibrio fructosivorans]EFL50745.1 Amidohydrolase 3 [Solidesulfovibrio fructosivorans JJ]]
MDRQTVPTLFTNGRIYQDAVSRVENILVADGLVAAVNVNPAAHEDAAIVDLDGGALYPGFCDSHVHLVESALLFSGADLRGKNDPDAITQAVAKALAAHPGDAPFIGAAFSLMDYDAWSLADLAKLDAVTGDRVVLLVDDLGHNMLANSAAMAKAGITAATPVPSGGEVVTQDGKATGMLREEAMTLAGNPLLPLFTEAAILPGTLQFMNAWAAMGYTGIVDLMGAPMGRINHPDMCRDMEKKGILPLRVNYNYTFFGLDDLEGGLAEKGHDTDLVRFVGNKLFIDGAYTSGQAWTTWENKKGGHGLHTVAADDSMGKNQNINRIIARLEEVGLNCHYHIQGDKALDVTLDALAAVVAKKGKLNGVHTLIHLAFPRPDQIRRIATFSGKVVTTMQPGFWQAEAGLERYYGEANNASYPVKEMIEAGVSVGMSTDFGVSPLELSAPTTIMNIAMVGGGASRTPVPVKDIVAGLSQGSNATTGRTDVGVLAPGMKADMVLYERDLYDVAPQDLAAANPKVLATWISGRKAFDAKEAPGKSA